MRWFRATCVVIAAIVLNVSPALGQTVGFDDIDASAGDVSLDALGAYQGLSWSNFYGYTTTPGFDGFNNGIVSQSNAAYSGGQTFEGGLTPVVGSIQSTSAFDFLSADLGAGYYDGLSLTITGYLGAAQLYTQTLTLGTTGAQSFGFSFSGIDRLTFSAFTTAGSSDPFACGAFNCTQFTMDNMAIRAADVTSPIPEPSTALMLLPGLGLVMAFRLRRRKPS